MGGNTWRTGCCYVGALVCKNNQHRLQSLERVLSNEVAAGSSDRSDWAHGRKSRKHGTLLGLYVCLPVVPGIHVLLLALFRLVHGCRHN